MIRPLPVRKSRGGSQGEICDFEALFFGSSSKFSYMKTVFEVKFHVTIMIMMSHTLKLFFEWESSFSNKILLQWWGRVVKALLFLSSGYDSRPMSRGGGMDDVHSSREMPQCWRKYHQQQNRRTAEAIMMQLVNSWTILNYSTHQ